MFYVYPSELDRQPRVVHWGPWGDLYQVVAPGRFLGIVAGPAGLAFLLVALALALFGTDQQGVVTVASIDKHRKTPTYHIEYTYIEGSAVEHDRTEVSSAEYSRLNAMLNQVAAGGRPPTILVRTLPFGINGHHFMISVASDESVWGRAFFPWGIVGLVALLISYSCIYGGFVAPWQERRLYERGLVVQGVITDKRLKFYTRHALFGPPSRFVTTRCDLYYTFTQLDGREREEKVRLWAGQWGKQIPIAEVGQTVTVLYYLDRKMNRIYEYGRYMCVDPDSPEPPEAIALRPGCLLGALGRRIRQQTEVLTVVRKAKTPTLLQHPNIAEIHEYGSLEAPKELREQLRAALRSSDGKFRLKDPTTGELREYHSLEEVPPEFLELLQFVSWGGTPKFLIKNESTGEEREYDSLDQVPPAFRKPLTDAMSDRTPTHNYRYRDASGRERWYNSLDEMPPKIRALFEKMAKAKHRGPDNG